MIIRHLLLFLKSISMLKKLTSQQFIVFLFYFNGFFFNHHQQRTLIILLVDGANVSGGLHQCEVKNFTPSVYFTLWLQNPFYKNYDTVSYALSKMGKKLDILTFKENTVVFLMLFLMLRLAFPDKTPVNEVFFISLSLVQFFLQLVS